MQCAACERQLEAFTGDVCPHCQHFAHPTKLGVYDHLELIKRGGMGSVYRARHSELGTVVAIKIVHTHTGPETLAERFEREASLAARIPHPGVVRVFDYDSQEGRLYLVMEFVEGATLRQFIGDEGRHLDWTLDKVAQLAEILHAAHERGIVHRDIKPENVMIDGTGRVRVLDFGISRVLDDGERLTQTGEILGTPEYIAPEQILDVPEAVDARTDIYATGVVIYELLTGHSPFAGTNLFQVLKNVESLNPPPPSQLRDGIPAALDELVMACMAREKERRPADCRALVRRLREIRTPGARATRRSRVAPIGLALVCLVAGFFAARWWPGAGNEVDAARPTPIATIRAIVDGPTPYDRYALAAASRAIPDAAAPDALYWRGMARKFTGSLFLALGDFEAARDAGYADAKTEAAILWIYKHRLFAMVVPGGSALQTPHEIDVDQSEPLAKGLQALAQNQHENGVRSLAQIANPTPDVVVLQRLAALAGAAGKTASPQAIASVEPRDYVPLRLLVAIGSGDDASRELETTLEDIDRMAPLRYFLEAAVAAQTGDDARLKAALELAQVTGEGDFALTVYVAIQLSRFDRLSNSDRTSLPLVAKELRGPAAETMRQAVQEKINGK